MGKDDQTAFEELYRRYWQRCYLQVARRSGDETLAEDITQNVFVSLWEKRKSLHIEHVAAYLFSAVRFRFITYLKRSEEHTSELQSLMRISYAVFCLKKKTKNKRS